MTVHTLASREDAPNVAAELWYTRCGVPTSFGIAVQRGLFKEEFASDRAATFRALQESSDPEVHRSHFTHRQENSFRHGSNYPAIWAQANGANTKVLGLSFLRGAQTVLALPESNIRNPADLKGKRLLVTRRPHEALDHSYANAIRFYEVALKQAGLTLDDVEIVERVIERSFIEDRRTPEIVTGQLKSAAAFVRTSEGAGWRDSVFPLIRDEVDVITSGGGIGASSLQLQQQAGLHVVFDLDWLEDEEERSNLSTPLVFAVKADLLERRPDLVTRVLYRTLQAEADAKDNPDELIRDLAREQLQSEFLVRKAFGAHLSEIFRIDFDPLKVAALKSQVRFLHAHKTIPAEIDVDSWLAPEPLIEARRRWAEERGPRSDALHA
ncbi:MAG: hypothetical protein C3F11_12045 [Methylocystaceae bacterium]|nr:MAG: hypothetical protein C3F11_12045 [Methylocystaceae bacterium]